MRRMILIKLAHWACDAQGLLSDHLVHLLLSVTDPMLQVRHRLCLVRWMVIHVGTFLL